MKSIKKYMHDYYKKFKYRDLEKRRNNYIHNKKAYKSREISNREKYMKDWSLIIPTKTKCGICGIIIYFNKKNPVKAIHFDHRHGDHDGRKDKNKTPTGWLMSHPRNKYNEQIWKNNDFGKLCKACNGLLPTLNRKQYIKKLVKYVFGKNYKILKEELE